MREKQSGIPILIKTRFYDDFGSVLRVILVVKINEKSSEKSMDFEGIPGETPLWDYLKVEGNALVCWPYNNIETGCRKTWKLRMML